MATTIIDNRKNTTNTRIDQRDRTRLALLIMSPTVKRST